MVRTGRRGTPTAPGCTGGKAENAPARYSATFRWPDSRSEVHAAIRYLASLSPPGTHRRIGKRQSRARSPRNAPTLRQKGLFAARHWAHSQLPAARAIAQGCVGARRPPNRFRRRCRWQDQDCHHTAPEAAGIHGDAHLFEPSWADAVLMRLVRPVTGGFAKRSVKDVRVTGRSQACWLSMTLLMA